MAKKSWLWGIVITAAVVATGLLVSHFEDPQRHYRDSGQYAIFQIEGKPAPAFEAKVVGAQSFSLEQVDKPTVFAFFGTFCPHCKAQIPVVRELATKYAGKANIYAVNGREFGEMPLPEREERVAAYLADNSWSDTPTLIASVEMQKAFKLDAVPSVVIIDRHRTVRYVGLANHSRSRLESLIEEAM